MTNEEKLSLVKQYVDSYREYCGTVDTLEAAMRGLSRDNYVAGACPEGILRLVDTLAIKLMGEQVQDWLRWWIWDCEFGTQHAVFYVTPPDGTEKTYEVNTIEALFEHCLLPNWEPTPLG